MNLELDHETNRKKIKLETTELSLIFVIIGIIVSYFVFKPCLEQGLDKEF